MKEFEDWTEDNPLSKFIRKREMTNTEACQALGVSNTTLYNWTHGMSVPGGKNGKALIETLGPDASIEWAEWLKRRPKLPRFQETQEETNHVEKV